MYPTISIPKLHMEYRLWINELSFCKEEIKIFENQLEELSMKNMDEEITAQIEQYQNQFIRQKEVIDELKHDLNISEKQLSAFAYALSGNALESFKMDNHPILREEMITFRKIYNELKNNFRRFESVCLWS